MRKSKLGNERRAQWPSRDNPTLADAAACIDQNWVITASAAIVT
jgi:hypothetical protein